MPPTSTPRDQPPAMTPSCPMRRPLHLELVAGDVLDVEVALDRPYATSLPLGWRSSPRSILSPTGAAWPAPLRIPGSQPLPDPDPAHTRPSRPTRHRRPCWPRKAAGMHDEHLERPTATEAIRQHPALWAGTPQAPGSRSGPLGIVTCATRARGDRRGPTHWLTVAALVLLRTKP